MATRRSRPPFPFLAASPQLRCKGTQRELGSGISRQRLSHPLGQHSSLPSRTTPLEMASLNRAPDTTEEHPEHITRYGPAQLQFVEGPRERASAARSARSSLKDDKSSTSCDLADDHDGKPTPRPAPCRTALADLSRPVSHLLVGFVARPRGAPVCFWRAPVSREGREDSRPFRALPRPCLGRGDPSARRDCRRRSHGGYHCQSHPRLL